MSTIRLTQFSPGAGCGCKIAPKDLEEILKNSRSNLIFENLLVGNDSKDDAAVYDIGDGKAIVSTTDFFTPIVDDPFDFGRISATNAISDIYAMGGKPLMAIAILGWPLDKLPAEIASKVISGAREVCDKAGIPLAGGHSINSTDPIFGLAVTGIVSSSKVKQNNSATEGCLLYLTKPLGIGLVSTAEKFGVARDEDRAEATKLMTTLNTAGIAFAERPEVKSMTDVTGFGLLGHSLEMAEGSGLKAVIEYDKVPRIAGVDYYIKQECIPGGTNRNFSSYGHKVSPMTGDQRALLCDPQTSGGLLLAVEKDMAAEFEKFAVSEGVTLTEIGYFVKKEGQYQIEVV
jgi:selenide,water dikinase